MKRRLSWRTLAEARSDRMGQAVVSEADLPAGEYLVQVYRVGIVERPIQYDRTLLVDGPVACDSTCQEADHCVLKPGNVLERCLADANGCLRWRQVQSCN